MRHIFCALSVGALVVSAAAQSRHGTYKPAGAEPVAWQINTNHSLVWGSDPYLPVGLRIDGTPAAVADAKAAGVTDVLVDLPVSGKGWAETFAALEKNSMRYLVRIDSLAPMSKGVAVEPQGYRVSGMLVGKTITANIPGATSALIVTAAKRDGVINIAVRVPIKDGKLSYTVKSGPQLDSVALIYPEMSSLEQPDYWTGMDVQRDTLLSSLRKYSPGKGLRGIVNPIGRTVSLPGRELRFVPTNREFRNEFRLLLEQRYKTIETVTKAWTMGSSIFNQKIVTKDGKPIPLPKLFERIARLIPLWQGSRGVSYLWDPETDQTIACDRSHSSIWNDIVDTVNATAIRRYSRLVAATRTVCDVPVIQEWNGWSLPYEVASSPVDGIGMKATGTSPSALAETGVRATSSVLRWEGSGWLPATDIYLGGGPDAASKLPVVLDDLTSMGARGLFIRTESPAMKKAVSDEAHRRESDSSVASTFPSSLFFPENAMNPAMPQRLPGSKWWIPCPLDGDRVDLGSQFYAYRMQEAKGTTFVIWAKTPGRYVLNLGVPKLPEVETTDGSDPAMRLVRKGIELNLSEFPITIRGLSEVLVPELTFNETVLQFEAILDQARTNRRDLTDEQIMFQSGFAGFERNPGASINLMRQTLNEAAKKAGAFTWVEIERSKENNFSEVVNTSAASGGGYLSIRTQLPPDEGYVANLEVPSHSKEDLEVWVAARIPAEVRGSVSVVIGGQVLPLVGDPIGGYGDDFGWYKLGMTRLASGTNKAKIVVNGSSLTEMGFDVLVFAPLGFKPNAVTLPLPSVDLKKPLKNK